MEYKNKRFGLPEWQPLMLKKYKKSLASIVNMKTRISCNK